MAKKSAAKKIETNPYELEGIAWLEAAERLARFGGYEPMAIELLYLRGSLTGDGTVCVALNIAAVLNTLTDDLKTTLRAVIDADGSIEAVRQQTTLEECVMRDQIIVSGLRWLRKLGSQ